MDVKKFLIAGFTSSNAVVLRLADPAAAPESLEGAAAATGDSIEANNLLANFDERVLIVARSTSDCSMFDSNSDFWPSSKEAVNLVTVFTSSRRVSDHFWTGAAADFVVGVVGRCFFQRKKSPRA